jgi:arylsulfatase A-like enzyme
MFIHFADPDVMGHRYGIHSPQKIQALEEVDSAIGMIVKAAEDAGILEESVFIISADHGSHDVTNKAGNTVGTHGSSKPEDVTIPWIVWGKGVKSGETITVPVQQFSTAATALWALDIPVPESFWSPAVTSAFEADCCVSGSDAACGESGKRQARPMLKHRHRR